MDSRRLWPSLASVLFVVGCGASSDTPAPADKGDPHEFAKAPRACVYDCPQTDCADLTNGYACPSLGEYAAIPHEVECTTPTQPTAMTGKCAASAPTGEAAKCSCHCRPRSRPPRAHASRRRRRALRRSTMTTMTESAP